MVASQVAKIGLLFAILLFAGDESPAELSRTGAAAMRAGRYAEAERIFRELVQREPGEAGWHANLGLALHSEQRYQEAVQSLERSLKMRPNAGLQTVLGIDYLKLRQPCRAIPALEGSERVEALADAYSGCGRHLDAAHLYEKLRHSRDAAREYWLARDYPSARRLYAGLAAQHLSEPEFAYEYGDRLLRVEGAHAAIPILERATSLKEGRAALGRALVEDGRFQEAIPHLEAAADVDSDLLMPLSRAYKAVGRTADAHCALLRYREQHQNSK